MRNANWTNAHIEGSKRVAVVIVEGGIVQDVLNTDSFLAWDWNDFKDSPADYWDEMGPKDRQIIRDTVHEDTLREIEEQVAQDMADGVEEELERRKADPFWMVPAI